MQFSIEALFATPLAIVDLNEVINNPQNVELLKEIEQLKDLVKNPKECFPNRGGNVRSNSVKVLDKTPRLARLLTDCIDQYSTKVLGESPKLSITGSWLNRNDQGAGHHPHAHLNSITSGVLYLQTPPDCGKFLAWAPLHTFCHIRDNIVENNQWNSDYFWYEPKQFQLYLFPSRLQHSVEANNNSESRISLSFNTFYNTLIGSDSHELDITSLSK